MTEEKQKDENGVVFENIISVQIMAIDGTWRRPCILNRVSEVGAALTVEGSVQGLNLTEFFLLLSSTGLAFRRCQLDRMNGDQMTVNFLRQRGRRKNNKEAGPAELS